MNLLGLTIPAQPQELASWLERQLVGRDLRDLVIELTAALGNRVQGESLREICGPHVGAIAKNGLAGLDAATTRRLLRSPESLLELQEVVLTKGGAFWRTVDRSHDHQQAVAAGWERLASQLSETSHFDVVDAASDDKPAAAKPTAPNKQRGQSRRSLLTILGTLTALGLVAAVVWMQQPRPGWGFNEPGLLTADIPARDYLNNLATAAGGWFEKDRSAPGDLKLRLEQFRKGCDTLLAAAHPQLAPEDRDWLKERCRVWAKKLDGHLADLQSGTKPFDEVKQDADGTIQKLVAALRERQVS